MINVSQPSTGDLHKVWLFIVFSEREATDFIVLKLNLKSGKEFKISNFSCQDLEEVQAKNTKRTSHHSQTKAYVFTNAVLR